MRLGIVGHAIDLRPSQILRLPKGAKYLWSQLSTDKTKPIGLAFLQDIDIDEEDLIDVPIFLARAGLVIESDNADKLEFLGTFDLHQPTAIWAIFRLKEGYDKSTITGYFDVYAGDKE